MTWSASELAIVDAGAKRPAGARSHGLLWPVWILPCDVDERVASARRLDLFEEAVLGLASAGMAAPAEAARTMGLHPDLVAFVQSSLEEQRLLDAGGALTPVGEALLERQLDERAYVRRTTAYVVLDAVTGHPLPRVLDSVEPSNRPPHTKVVPPAVEFLHAPPPCTSAELSDALRLARSATGAFCEIVAVHPSSRAERCYLCTFAYRRSLKDLDGDVDPTWSIDDDVCVADPFGLVLRSDSQTAALRDAAGAGGWRHEVRASVAPPAGSEAEDEARYQERCSTKAAELADRLPGLARHPAHLAELATAHVQKQMGAIGPALIALTNVLDGILHEVKRDHPWDEAFARLPQEDSAKLLHLQEALDVCGLDSEVPSGMLSGVRDDARGSVRASFVKTVLAAADDESHPLHDLTARDGGGEPSRWLLDLDALIDGRNPASHVSDARFASVLARVPFSRFEQMADQAAELLLGAAEVHA
jgi:hypothetical protein